MRDPLPVAVEGVVDEAVVARLLAAADLPPGEFWIAGGKPKFNQRLAAQNEAARFGVARLAVRDLDADAHCPDQLVRTLLPDRCDRFCFRIAVREIESWLMADAEGLAKFLGIKTGAIPKEPETLPSPKDEMVALARRSRRTALRRGMLPEPASGRKQGPAYATYMIEFAQAEWSPQAALDSRRSPSLNRTFHRLTRLAKTGSW